MEHRNRNAEVRNTVEREKKIIEVYDDCIAIKKILESPKVQVPFTKWLYAQKNWKDKKPKEITFSGKNKTTQLGLSFEPKDYTAKANNDESVEVLRGTLRTGINELSLTHSLPEIEDALAGLKESYGKIPKFDLQKIDFSSTEMYDEKKWVLM